MTFDKPKPRQGHILTSVQWERDGDHCRVRRVTQEPVRRARPEPAEAPRNPHRHGLLL